MSKSQKKNNISSAVQVLSQSTGIAVDDLDLEDIDNSTEEKKKELLIKISETIKKTLKDLKEKGKQGLNDYLFEEKIALLERTKSAVEAFLLQILSSPNTSGKAYEALSMIIKVNAELLRDLTEETKEINSQQQQHTSNRNGENTTTIVVAPSEAMLDGILKQRHKHQNISKDKNPTVEDQE